ncbi:MAG TPA: hypothetical protein VH593_00980, partial [Ktedonobacteraceae bacterium]
AKIVKWFHDIWNSVYNTVKNFVHNILAGIRNLWDSGVSLVKNFVSGVIRIITGLPGLAAAALAQLGTKVAAKFTSMGKSAYSAVTKFVGDVVSFMGGLPGKIVSALANLGSTVATKIRTAFASAKTWVTNAFTDAGQWLLKAGENIIGGLATGLWNATVGKLTSTLGKVGSWIKSHKGPESVDRVLLQQSGQWIMEGLVKGIENRLPHLTTSLNKVTGTIKSGVKTAPLHVPAGAHAYGGVGANRVVNLFPYATIDFGKESPQQVIQRLEVAIRSSRL